MAGLAPETETALQPPGAGTPPRPPSLVIHLMHMHITSRHTHTHTETMHRPVLPAGLSAFSLLPRHLHTNTVCWGPGTNTSHSTFHYWALIIVGTRGRRRTCGEGEGPEDGERRRELTRRRERWRGGMTGSLISPSVKTHLGAVHAQLKSSLRHLLSNTRRPCSPHPPGHLSSSSAPSVTPHPSSPSNHSKPHS